MFLLDTNVLSELRRPDQFQRRKMGRQRIAVRPVPFQHQLLVTRNRADFEPMGVALLNPWE
jgi:predicted nucleic acid-binding protein